MSASSHGAISVVRKTIVAVIIVSFSVAAIGGIVVLLGGAIDDTAGRVLLTTAVVGGFSVAVLCCAALAGRRAQTVGLIGAVVSTITAVLIVIEIWVPGAMSDGWFQVLWTAVSCTVAFSLASLLLLLADRRQAAVRVGLTVTLALFAVVLGMIVFLIWWTDAVDDQVFPRVLGIAGILAALGAVVVPVLSLLLRRRPGAELSPEAAARLQAEATRRSTTPEALLASMLDSLPGPAPAPAPGATAPDRPPA